MREFISKFRPYFSHAALFSFCINLLLLVPPLFTLQVFDRVLSSQSKETLAMLLLAVFVAMTVMTALEILRSRLLTAAAVLMDRKLGPRVLHGLLANAARIGGTEYVHGLRDAGALRNFLAGPGIMALFDAPWIPIYMLVIFMFHPLMGITAVVGAAVLFGLTWMNERLTREKLEKLQTDSRGASRFIDTTLRHSEVIAALGMQHAVVTHWQGLNEHVLSTQADTSQRAGVMTGLTKFARQFIQSLMMAVGAWLVIEQHVSGGVMIAGTIMFGRALAPVEAMIGGWKSLVDARSAYGRLKTLLDEKGETADPVELPAPEGNVLVERVVFGMRGQDRAIIKGVSFELKSGEALAIVGASASGKSTLARLIVGVWKPVSGVVRLDNADIALWPRERLGPYIGYVPQDVELFAGSVAENIARLGAIDSEQVVAAAQRAQAHDMILRLPNGYDTQIGDGGAVLSGGQRQRIALARALYGSPRLVVLDEPNANLDSEGEEALLRAMQTLKQQGVTLVVISHRPSLLQGVDKMMVLREGVVEVFGPRAEIMAKIARNIPQVSPVPARGAPA
jgi:PrtD family type I secretion system ABC transporter